MTSAFEPRRSDNIKLPLWATIRLSYTSYFSNFADVLRITWLWLVVLVPLASVVDWQLFSELGQVVANAKNGTAGGSVHPPAPPAVFQGGALGDVFSLVFILAGLSIAVAWHRCILLGEHPRLSGSNLLSKSLWRYVLVGLALLLIFVLIVALPSAAILLPAFFISQSAAQPLAWLGVLFALMFYMVAIAVLLRLIPLLPARAIGNLNLTFKQAWNATRGNNWRLFWGLLACALPPGLLMQILILIGFSGVWSIDSQAFVLQMTVIYTILTAFYLLIMPVSIGFLSLSYRHFFERT